MRRCYVLGLALLAGCVNATALEHPDIVADLACETARMVVQLGQEMAPAPASDKCDNCDGKGKVRSGDGISVFTCPVCKGTGKRPKAATSGTCTTGACKP